MLAITALHCQKRTSLYTFGSEFRHCRNIASDVTGGILAASEDPRRIRTAMDGSSSKLQQVFSSEKLVVEQRTLMYAVQQACGYFFVRALYLPRLFSKSLFKNRHGCTRLNRLFSKRSNVFLPQKPIFIEPLFLQWKGLFLQLFYQYQNQTA